MAVGCSAGCGIGVSRTGLGSDGPLKAPHLQAAPTVFDANLLSTAGDGEGIAMLALHIEQLGQGADTTEGGSLVIDAATPAAGVVVDAPAVRSHHRKVLTTLVLAEGLKGLGALFRVQAAAGSAGRNATPAVTTRHCSSPAGEQIAARARKVAAHASASHAMGFIDIHLIANFAALALITLAGPAVIFILFYRRGAL